MFVYVRTVPCKNFQLDNVQVQGARGASIAYATPQFIASDLWPPTSFDMNPVHDDKL